MLNEAALLTARTAATTIDNAALDEAIDRVISGPQKRTRLMNEHERSITAYHEGGHALVAAALPQSDPVHKITILPRGRALGYTMVLPDEDKYSQTRAELLDKLAYMLGGRAAEELVFHDPTTGAGNDIEKATNLARAMVTQYGMSERIGAVRLGEDNGQPFLGRDIGHSRNYSEDVAAIVDDEISKLIAYAHQEAFDILVENRDVLDALVPRAAGEGDARQGRGRRDLRGAATAATSVRRGPARRRACRRRSRRSLVPRRSHGHAPERDGDEGTIVVAPGPDAGLRRPRRRPGRRNARASVARSALTWPDAAALPVRHARAEAAVRELLAAIGEDPDRDGLRDTPARVARVVRRAAPRATTRTPRRCCRAVFEVGHDELVLVKDIELWSHVRAPPGAVLRRRPRRLHPRARTATSPACPSWPGSSTSTPAGRRCRSGSRRRSPRRWSRSSSPHGVIVVIEAEHLCMTMRGVRKAGAKTITSAVRGQLRDPATRAEAMNLITGR